MKGSLYTFPAIAAGLGSGFPLSMRDSPNSPDFTPRITTARPEVPGMRSTTELPWHYLFKKLFAF